MRRPIYIFSGAWAGMSTPLIAATWLRTAPQGRFWALMVFSAAGIAAWLWCCYCAARLDLNRLRSHIASDLHDDIGASLAQLVLLSQVASRQAGGDPGTEELLGQIGQISRGLVDSMSDIVWSINSGGGCLTETLQRMRRFAASVLGQSGIRFRVQFPERPECRPAAETCRQLLLIFKESIHNVVRHSHCTEVEIRLMLERGCLLLRIADNGSGFDPRNVSRGCGLSNMTRRARSVSGDLRIESGITGTVITAKVPLGGGSRPRKMSHVRNRWPHAESPHLARGV